MPTNKLLKTLNNKLKTIAEIVTTITGTPPNEVTTTTGYYKFYKTGYIEDIQALNRSTDYPALLCIIPDLKDYQRSTTFPYTKFALTFYAGNTWVKGTDDEFEKYDDICILFNQFVNALALDSKFEITGIDNVDTNLIPEGLTKDFALFCKFTVNIKFFKDAS